MDDASETLEKKGWSVYSFLVVWDNKQKVIKNAGIFLNKYNYSDKI